MTTTSGRVPPHSIEAEEQLLSACIIDGGPTASAAINAGVTPASFYVPANRLLFGVMIEQFTANQPFDLAALGVILGERKQLGEIGGYGYLTRVAGAVPTTASASFFIQRVVELAQLRQAINAATAIVENCYAYTGGGPREHLGRDMERLNEALAVHAQSRSWSAAVAEAKEAAIERMKPAKDRVAGSWSVSWPWLDLEKCFLPIEPGELVTIAARPSVGKSSLARQLAWASACSGIPTLFHSLEVGDAELATNLAANVSGVRSRRDLDRLHPTEREALIDSFDHLASPAAPFSVVAEDDSLMAMIARANAFKARHGMRLWVIDYLGLISDCMDTRKGENTAAAIGRVTRTLKRFATANGVPVVLLAQLNRGVEQREGPPRLSDLRDSGRIEEDSNRVILLHRPTEYMAGGARVTQDSTSSPVDEPNHYVEVIQAKGRNTGTASVALSFNRPTATFRNFTQ